MNGAVVRLGEAACQPAMRGIDLVADLVAGTIGPAGRAVLVGRDHATPLLLRNGHAIAKNLDLADRGGQTGVLLMRELAWRTSDAVGDGTSTAILAARAFARAGAVAGLAGIPQAELAAMIEAHRDAVLDALAAEARPAPDAAALRDFAIQAVGGDAALGELLAEAHERAGADGLVLVEEGRGTEDALRFDAGLHLDQGWLSPHLVDDRHSRAIEIEDALVLLHAGPIEALEPMLRVLEMIAEAKRGLVIIADSLSERALATLIQNKRRAGLKIAALKAPGAGPWRRLMLEDIAIATGGGVIAEDLGTSLKTLRPHLLGAAGKVRVGRDGTAIIGPKGEAEAIAARCAAIRDAIAREKHLSFDREQHQKRLARLRAGIATLRVGARTPSQLKLRLDQARNASAALAAALAGGLSPGGGAALVHAARAASAGLPQDIAGRLLGRMFARASEAPLFAIARNAGAEPDLVVPRVAASTGLAFDARTRGLVPAETILDPLPVVRTAFRNAVSSAARLLCIGAAVGARRHAVAKD